MMQPSIGSVDSIAPTALTTVDIVSWALGLIAYEFLYGNPSFHSETPEKVFENTLSGHIGWHEDLIDFSTEALDFMNKLLTVDPARRLGTNDATEVKVYPCFNGLNCDNVTKIETAFIPEVNDRGAAARLCHDEEAIPVVQSATTLGLAASIPIPLPILG